MQEVAKDEIQHLLGEYEQEELLAGSGPDLNAGPSGSDLREGEHAVLNPYEDDRQSLTELVSTTAASMDSQERGNRG